MVTYDQLMLPLMKALEELGGSGNVGEIYEKVIKLENFDEETLSVIQDTEKSNWDKIGYRLALARTYLKKAGYLENSSRGVWALTKKAKKADKDKIDGREIAAYVRSLSRPSETEDTSPEAPTTSVEPSPEETLAWREKLHHILTAKEMTPEAFERLTQRILRESGFVHVEVTGRTGDGGIDGKGVARINGLMSFHIAFQCKKHKGSIGAPDIRDFRGATIGRADRGMFITTGSFTKKAVKEANRDGAAPIDLVDGEELADKLKKLGLGIKTELVEKVIVDSDWFLGL